MDEAKLIGQARSGDVHAFNELVLLYQDSVYRLAYRIMGEAPSAADAAQEAFISAYRGLEGFRGGSFKSWLLRIVTNACYDELRRRKRRPAEFFDDLTPEDSPDPPPQLVSDDDSPEDQTLQSELSRAIEDCIRALPQGQQLLVVLRDVEGFDYQAIADNTGLELGTVKSRLSRARTRLRDCLRGLGELLPEAYRLRSE